MKRQRRPVQREIAFPETWGGRRKGAGRKPQGKQRQGPPHRSRPALASKYPVHVTMRVVPGLGSLRAKGRYQVVKKALRQGCDRGDFRLVEYSVQSNHLHCVCEAHHAKSLGNGVRALAIRIARAVNGFNQRKGTVFGERYHARILRTPREVRNCLCYVLQNFKHHARRAGRKVARDEIDMLSSASWFKGYRPRPTVRVAGPSPVAEATTWLLKTGWWKHHEKIRPSEVPRGNSPR